MVVFTSCEDDVKFNTPAVQGLKDNELWKADDFTATLGVNNSLTIQATTGFETVVLKTSAVSAGTYTLGLNSTNMASYSVAAESGVPAEYITANGVGSGEIIIIPEDTNIAAGYITGTFHFNAEDSEGNVVYFQEGIFYKVRLH